MKTTVKVAVRMSEVRQRLNEIAGMEDLDDEVRSEAEALGNEYSDLEVRHRAGLRAEADGETVTEAPPADPDMAELESRAALSGILSGIMSGRGPAGAEAELQAELNLGGDQVPLALLRPTEHRTAGQTPAPSTVGAMQQPIIDAVFPRSASAYLGVRMPTVPVGESVFTVLTTNLAPGIPDGGAEQAASAGAFTPTTLEPHRIQGSFFIRREDRAKLAGMEQALRMNLSDAMASKLDSECIAGTEGFLGSDGLPNPTNPSAVATYTDYRSLVFDPDVVDGLYAYMASDVRVLMNPSSYAHAASVFRGNNDNTDALAALRRDSGGVQVSAHIPTAPTTGNGSNDQSILLAKDMREHAVAPIWEGVQVIVDEVTQAKSGEIVFTSVMLWGRLAILREAGFARKELQTA